MATLKIYGVRDLMEWEAVIPCKNGSTLHVRFEGGSASANGTVPAKYRTDNPIFQSMIESSELFKKGKIKLLNAIPRDGSVASFRMAPMKQKVEEAPVEAKADVKAEKKAEPVKAAEDSAEVKAEPVALSVVKVSDIESDGRNYLVKHFGVKVGQLRSMKAIMEQAKAHGIEFVIE